MSSFLTKPKFVRALKCPTKLYYSQHGEYKSTLEDNDFMQLLAADGLQVEVVAKLYFFRGHEIPMTHEKSKSLSDTNALIQQDKMLYQIDKEADKVLNPNKLLAPTGHCILDYETVDETIEEGSTAMIAWFRIQFKDVSPKERAATFKVLFKYCELDTLAIVMIHQHWGYLHVK